MFVRFVRQEKMRGQRNKMNKILPKCQKSNDFIFSFFSSSFNSWTFFYTMLDVMLFFLTLSLWYVINRSFICGREAIRRVHMQYSVHTIKIKFNFYLIFIFTLFCFTILYWFCIKQNTGEKIIQLKRYSGKALCSFDYSLYPTGLTTLTKIIQTF